MLPFASVFVLSGNGGKLYLLLIFARFVLKYNHSDTIKEETTRPVVSRHPFFSSLIMSACPIVPKGFFSLFSTYISEFLLKAALPP